MMNRITAKLRALLPCSNETNRMVFKLLDEVRDSGGNVILQTPGDGSSYQCCVPALSAVHRVFVITDLPPMEEVFSSLNTSKLTVVVKNQNRIYNLSCELIEPLLPDHSMGYQLKFKNLCMEARQRNVFNLLHSSKPSHTPLS